VGKWRISESGIWAWCVFSVAATVRFFFDAPDLKNLREVSSSALPETTVAMIAPGAEIPSQRWRLSLAAVCEMVASRRSFRGADTKNQRDSRRYRKRSRSPPHTDFV
jgi:hypothetical protein